VASGWTAKVLAELHRADPRCGDELRLISSVSGGSVATAYYLAAHHAPLDQRALQQVLAASMRSSLSPAAYGLAFADLRRGLFPIWVDESFDRGRLLEADWRARGQRLYHGLDIDVGSPHDADLQPLTAWIEHIRRRRAPGVIFNSTVMESGQRVAITPLSTLHAEWRSGSGLGGEPPERFQSPPTLGEFLAGGDQLTVDLWTAARVSATFAYVSPPARRARTATAISSPTDAAGTVPATSMPALRRPRRSSCPTRRRSMAGSISSTAATRTIPASPRR
jgi:hypothetical protein